MHSYNIYNIFDIINKTQKLLCLGKQMPLQDNKQPPSHYLSTENNYYKSLTNLRITIH